MTGQVAHGESLVLLHLSLPNIALGMTGTPISSKQALEDPSDGGIHSEVSLTLVSNTSLYYMPIALLIITRHDVFSSFPTKLAPKIC